MVSVSTFNNMVPTTTTLLSLYMLLLCPFFLCCSSLDSVTSNGTFTIIDGGTTLVSAGEIFVLGFFSPNGSSGYGSPYVGIWYYKLEPLTVVWVANRDNPVPYGTGSSFVITEDGNLKVLDKEGIGYWTTTDLVASPSSLKTAKLLDSGNLIFCENSSGKYLWESFKNTTDTFLPGMKMDEDIVLTSWKSLHDPAAGNYAFHIDEDRKDQFKILKRSSPYWRSGESDKIISSDHIPIAVASLLSNARTPLKPRNSTFYKNLTVPSSSGDNVTRLVMGFDGVLRLWYLSWDSNQANWSSIWSEPRDPCSVYNACGNFGSCNINNGLMCKCLPGFEPSSVDNWNSGEFSGGCERKSPICGESDRFLSLNMMKVGNPDTHIITMNMSDCGKECLNTSICQAYLFDEPKNSTRRNGGRSAPKCWIWNGDLINLREEYVDGGRSLYIRVGSPDKEVTARNCEPCGTNIIPYPLSTGPNCGDPLYYSFHCNNFTGQVSFQTLGGGRYRVTDINPIARKFSIQDINAHNCRNRSSSDKILLLNKSSPFHLSNCSDAALGDFTYDQPPKRRVEYQISWNPPLEPTCASSADCSDWPESTCNATQDGKKKCLCNAHSRWDQLTMNCTRVAEVGDSRRKMPLSLTIAVTCIVFFLIALSCTIAYVFYTRKRRRASTSQGHRNDIQSDHALHQFGSESHVKHLLDSGDFREDDKKGIDVPFFDLQSILAATDNFSDTNKLGQGGFGPVYKGKFQGDQEIAVKRLSSLSGQGLQEFKNEVVLIAKLQHRNLVRLLGYCISGEEKILLYEYMPNKSLDSFIFDRTLSVLLNWEVRFNIILGVARGLLYLHQDSRLRIIHRDLKTSNILLDEEMNPKISDFGLARIFEGKQTEAATERIIGTYGYMSPEYALEGFFSVKSDVFSFGVVVLEIISGKRTTGSYQSEQSLSLLGYAWRFWKEEKALELMDQTLLENCNTSEFLKCVNVGLLCVQEDPSDRPTMSNVVSMLGSETATLPSPKQPAFVAKRGLSTTGSSSSKQEACSTSNNELSITLEDGR